jgi:hypothetical protein
MTSPTPLNAPRTEPEPEERRLPGHRMRVLMAGGAEFEVRITNRDRVAWDKTAPRHKWGTVAEVPFLASTFLAWSASYREGLTDLKFEAFEKECDHLEDLRADEAGDDARPTR